MLRYSKSLYQLRVEAGDVRDQHGNLFDRVGYSRSKYGHVVAFDSYGADLARLIEADLAVVRGYRPTIIVSAPYKFVPTSSHVIALAMRRYLANSFVKLGIEPPVIVPFHKARTGSGAYAKGSLEDRLRSLATLGLSIDESLVKGANVLVVDDIRITGSAQSKTADFIETIRPYSVWYLHGARLNEKDAATHPGIENELNQSYPKNLQTILSDVEAGEFVLNARVLGFIMKTPDLSDFTSFVQSAPGWFLGQLYEATIGSGLAYVARFPTTLPLVESELQNRGLWQSATSVQPKYDN